MRHVFVFGWAVFSAWISAGAQARAATAAADDIVLLPSQGKIVTGSATTNGWQLIQDSTAAGGASVFNPNQGAPKIATPLAAPVNYVEMSFNAVPGTPYHVWVRLKAQDNATGNDSIHIQFSGSLDSNGQPVYRTDSAQSASFILQNCTGAIHEWGWTDNTWCGTAPTLVHWDSAVAHTLRIQQREDGASIDQIILSPAKFLTSSPGARLDDTNLYGTGAPPAGGVGGGAKFGHIVFVVLENHSYSTIIGNPNMPYINSLASKYASAKNYWPNVHPSQPNYYILTTGKVFYQNSNLPSGTPNIVKSLLKAGMKWKAYFESADSSTAVFRYFPEVANNPAQLANIQTVAPNFANDYKSGKLPQYSMIHPSTDDSGHNCVPNSNPNCPGLKVADDWLKANIDPYINSAAFKANNDLLIIGFDEGDLMLSGCGDPAHLSPIVVTDALRKAGVWTCGDHAPLILVGPSVKPGYKSTTTYHNESVLRLSLEGLGINTSLPGASATAPAMTEFFK